jgi:hypothetical protein
MGGLFLVAGLLLGLVVGCDSGDVETLGFLGDYTQLAPGRAGQADLIFIDDTADFSTFSTMLVEKVVPWAGPDGEVDAATLELATKLDEGLRRELGLEYELVDAPKADTIRLRAAVSADPAEPVVLEVELLEAGSGRRLIGAVDRREIEPAIRAKQPDVWAVLIRDRLATFRGFDAAARARDEAGDGS